MCGIVEKVRNIKVLPVILAVLLCISVQAVSAQNAQKNPDSDVCKNYSKHSFEGERISPDFINADIREVLRYFSDKFGINFVIDKSIGDSSLTIHVKNVPWNTVLKEVLDSQGLGIKLECPVFYVAKTGVIENRNGDGLQASTLYTEFIRLKNLRLAYNDGEGLDTGDNKRADYLAQVIKPLLSRRGGIEFDEKSDSVIITDTRNRVKLAAELINILESSNFTFGELMAPRSARPKGESGKTVKTQNLFPVVICTGGRPLKEGEDQPVWAADQGILLFEMLRFLPLGRWRNFSRRQLDVEGTEKEIELSTKLIELFDRPFLAEEFNN